MDPVYLFIHHISCKFLKYIFTRNTKLLVVNVIDIFFVIMCLLRHRQHGLQPGYTPLSAYYDLLYCLCVFPQVTLWSPIIILISLNINGDLLPWVYNTIPRWKVYVNNSHQFGSTPYIMSFLHVSFRIFLNESILTQAELVPSSPCRQLQTN